MKNTLTHISAFLLTVLAFTATPAFAHNNPLGCTGSSLGIALYASPKEGRAGDTISYSVDVANGSTGGPIACDATDITASLVTPDGTSHPLTLIHTTLLNGELDTYSNVVTYIVREQDIKSDGTLTATASDTGNIHQNDTDSVGGSNQGVNINGIKATPVTPTPPPIVTTGSSNSGGGGSGGCAYGFNFDLGRCNYTPLSVPIVPIVTTNIPTLPNTGFPPESDIILYTRILLVVAIVSAVIVKKHFA